MKIQISKTKIAVVAPRLVQCVNCGHEFAVKDVVELFDGDLFCYPCARDIQAQIAHGTFD